MRFARRHFLLKTSALGIGSLLATLWGQIARSTEVIENNLSEIDRRIQQIRTAPLTVRLQDSQGNPIASQSLKIKHLRHLFNFGATYQAYLYPANDNESDRRLRENFLRLFNASTVTFYWRSYEPQENQFADAPLLEQIAWLKEHGFYLRGHPLFWNHNPACLPVWLEGRNVTDQELRSRMDRLLEHLSEVIFPHLDEVDVFNELVHWDSYQHPLTDLLKNQGKIPIVKQYLTRFKKLNPNVKAVINDFVSKPSYAEMLNEFQAAQVPWDQIGQQAHMFFGNWPSQHLTNVIQRLSAIGKSIVFTEVSSLSGAIKEDIDFSRTYTDWVSDREHEQQQADYLDYFYRLAFSYPQITGIFLWSFSDHGAWLGAPTGILHQDGRPKPAFTQLDKLINQVWRTNGEYITDSSGYVRISNAYEGEYQITVSDQVMTGQHSFSKPLEILKTLS
ncbi:MAG: endo-1,4-beta-xylanase [Snowella sp.]|nr:endo-1,4-beta-xylanase [Snowella sp.]